MLFIASPHLKHLTDPIINEIIAELRVWAPRRRHLCGQRRFWRSMRLLIMDEDGITDIEKLVAD